MERHCTSAGPNDFSMKSFSRTTAIVLALWTYCLPAIGCASAPDAEPTTIAFKIALDPKVPLPERINAALILDESSRERLRTALAAQLPGHWNRATLTAIQILGEIGNQATVEKLEAIDELPHNSSGKFHFVILDAIARIEQRIQADSLGGKRKGSGR